MRKISAIGMGTGNPKHLTVEAIEALSGVDAVFSIDKGSEKAALSRIRREICERYLENKQWRWIELRQGGRDPRAASYAQGVEQWHEERLLAYEHAIAHQLGEDERAAILVWGDPSLYDSTLRLLELLRARGQVAFEYDVIPGISSPQVLAARHKIPLNRIAGAVQITTGRRLSQGLPAEADDVVVMLDGECSFRRLPAAQLEIYWGAYLGTDQEILISGPLAECKDEIERVRSLARAEHGWIMDTYLLRKKVPG
ncbi:MAG TPA: precorrin-6A synthase (deacetylating) [Polyangiaceae bacterium]|nr:precorrin-6A synthase (deacetylating) [Polyangiaceae bacterium]